MPSFPECRSPAKRLRLRADQARTLLDDGDLRAEAAIHLAELEADVAAADDDQMLGQKVDAPSWSNWSRYVNLIESRHRRDARLGRRR